MRIKHPVNAKSTKRMLRILPPDWKMVNDETSNGYKFFNMVLGTEIDELTDRLQVLYDSLFLDTIDLSEEGHLYQVELSGTPDNLGFLNSDGIKIKITNEDEFYNGEPTRFNYIETYSIPDTSNTIIGANYFRADSRGSGYFILTFNNDEGESYASGIYTAKRIYTDNTGEILSSSGFYTGIATEDFENTGRDELITPIEPLILSGRYPKYRKLTISGVNHYIGHYEPYKGWTYDSDGNVVAVNDYFQEYYFDSQGDKVFHRTYLNNPYGSGNYNKQYFTLRHVPISGTLKVYDIDNLDSSGNAKEIPQSGINMYYLKYSGMLDGEEGGFEPVYKGYSKYVPSGEGFNYIEGDEANLLTTISWDYQRVGSKLDSDSRSWVEPSSGDFTNMISITNPQTRYIVQYKWKRYNKANYISSFDSTRYLSLDTTQPAYSIENVSGNIEEADFSFTKNPKYTKNINGSVIDERAQILTFDGWKYRPDSRIKKVDLNIPIIYTQTSPLNNFYIGYRYKPIGYSTDMIPRVNSIRKYEVNCPFDNAAPGYNSIEDDITGKSNFCRYTASGSNKLFKIPYNSWFGKKIIYFGGDSYYYINMTNNDFIKPNMFYKFGFRPLKNQEITLLEYFDDNSDKYHIITIDQAGKIHIEIDGYEFVSRNAITMDSGDKELIVRYYPDDLISTIPVVELFIKDQEFYFEVFDLLRREVSSRDVSSTYLHLYKSCEIEIDKFQIYYEAF